MVAPVFILAGEPSGDRLGASLMRAITAHYGKKKWIGTGGPAMRAQGLRSHFPMEELTVFGFGAAVRAYPRLSQRLDMLVKLIVAEKPEIIMTVDAKGFAVRLALVQWAVSRGMAVLSTCEAVSLKRSFGFSTSTPATSRLLAPSDVERSAGAATSPALRASFSQWTCSQVGRWK